MRTGFTLMEILVAAAIASIAGMALMQSGINNTHLFQRITAATASQEMMSVIGFHSDVKYNRTDKTLYDLLEESYDITNDDLRQYLKSKKYAYSEQLIETITFGDEGQVESFADEAWGDEAQAGASEAGMVQFELVQVSVRHEDESGTILKARGLDAQ